MSATATRLVGEWDVSRSEKTGRRTSRFRILVKKGPLTHGPEPRALGPCRKNYLSQHKSLKRVLLCIRQRGLQQRFCVRAKKNVPFALEPGALSMSFGGPPGTTVQNLGPWGPSRKIPLSTYLNGFTIVTSWTRLRKV